MAGPWNKQHTFLQARLPGCSGQASVSAAPQPLTRSLEDTKYPPSRQPAAGVTWMSQDGPLGHGGQEGVAHRGRGGDGMWG